jgi:hypothetical protein
VAYDELPFRAHMIGTLAGEVGAGIVAHLDPNAGDGVAGGGVPAVPKIVLEGLSVQDDKGGAVHRRTADLA